MNVVQTIKKTEPKDLNFNSWAELRVYCPIDIERIIFYANNFEAFASVRISEANINKAKRSLIEARGQLDLMITTLNQLLYDRTILKNRIDEVLLLWLMDNLGRFLRTLDKHEQDLLVDYDNPDPTKSRIGISRLSAYGKTLRIASQSVIFETLLKATKEYWSFEETSDLKREPRTFVYILFHILHITLFSLGSISRTGTGGGQPNKKDLANFYPTSWQGMLSNNGQRRIADAHQEATGEDISDQIPPELDSRNSREFEYDDTYEEAQDE